MTQRIVSSYIENLDPLTLGHKVSPTDLSEWLSKKYGGNQVDVGVAVGPEIIKFLASQSQAFSRDAPIVICGSAADQEGNPGLDSRFTGTRLKGEPSKTLEAALRLVPNTDHVFVVGDNSVFDESVTSFTKEALGPYGAKLDIVYLSGMVMGDLLQRLRRFPGHSVLFYASFFEDGAGNEFLNATKAPPTVAQASAVSATPVFGMSDTYWGHGIVGGDLMVFQEQAKVTARIVADLLDGKRADDIPIETLSSVYMFDWNQLRRWHIQERALPPGSIVMFREPTLWEHIKWVVAIAVLIIMVLSGLVIYLQYSRRQLEFAKQSQRQLSGMLIHAKEQECRRLASELHDDFSQRLAVLSLNLENLTEEVPSSLQGIQQHLHELVNSTSELGSDLHTLSHCLYSSTLDSLGLVPAINALCKECAAQQGVSVDFHADGVPRSIPRETALCVFRIVQEGLRNFKKHSGATNAQVNLQRTGNRLVISVRDEGRGFSVKELRHSEGLGIRSMIERASLLGGQFNIQSAVGKGTTIEAWVSLDSKVTSEDIQP
jgi:signal transduction histidine kinase